MTLGPRTKLVGAPRTHALPGRGGGPRSFAGKALFCGTCRREWACGGGDVERARTLGCVPRYRRGNRGRAGAAVEDAGASVPCGGRGDGRGGQVGGKTQRPRSGMPALQKARMDAWAAARELQDPESSWRLLSRIVVSARLRSAACLRSVSMYPGAREGKQARGRSGAPVSHRISLLMSTFTLPLAALARRWGAENGSNLRQGSA